jgi:MFS family permease
MTALQTNRLKASPDPEPPVTTPSLARAWYSVGVLFAVYILSFVDRQMVNLLVDPIRADLHVSDTQVSLLQGFAFAVFYTFMGLPIAWAADNYRRPAIIGAGLFLWSVMTAACGLARSFPALFLARIGVGVGEATLSPAAFSFIADAFPRNLVTRAVGIFASAQSVGGGVALIVGGAVVASVSAPGHAGLTLPLVGALKPWQAAFMIVGLAGLPFLALAATLRDPPRRESKAETADFGAFLAHLNSTKLFLFFVLGAEVFTTIAGYSSQSWFVVMFMRVHGLPIAKVGLIVGSSIAVFGTLGLLLAARFSEVLARRGRRDGIMLVMSFGALGIAIGNLVLSQGSLTAAIVGMMIMVGSNATAAIVPATLQLTTPGRLRARVSALMLFTLNLLGLGLGPTIVAMTTDYVFHDPKAVGSAVALVGTVCGLVAALLFRLGCRPYLKALDRMEDAA